jgi:hypothetical protein
LGSCRKSLCVCLLMFAALLCCLPGTGNASCPATRADCNFTIVTPEFESPAGGRMGANVALALQHQIFKTFRISIPRAGADDFCCMPRDTLAMLGPPLVEQSQLAAEQYARDHQPSSLVLWGKAWPWGEFVVVQPYLSIIGPPTGVDPGLKIWDGNYRQRPFTADGQWRIWEISATDSAGNTHTLAINQFPREFYDLPQISLDARTVEQFQSLVLVVYQAETGNAVTGARTSGSIEALRHGPKRTQISSPPGWIELPTVDAGRSIDFIGGIFHFMRGNWERAESSFEKVAKDELANSGIRVDAALLLAASRFRLDPGCAKCDEALAIATAINPYSIVTARFEMMAALAQANVASDYLPLRARLETQRSLHPPDDSFTKDAKSFMGSIAPE